MGRAIALHVTDLNFNPVTPSLPEVLLEWRIMNKP